MYSAVTNLTERALRPMPKEMTDEEMDAYLEEMMAANMKKNSRINKLQKETDQILVDMRKGAAEEEKQLIQETW
mgnify:CR=1 FL=1